MKEELETLERELEEVNSLTEKEVCKRFNADSKAEYIEVLNEEIRYCKNHLDD